MFVAGNIAEDIKTDLEKEGFTLCLTEENPAVLEGLRFHPDMQIAAVDKTYVCDRNLFDTYKPFFESANAVLVCGDTALSCNYPYDIAYNIKVIGNNVFHNFKHTDDKLISMLKNKNMINVPQGYSGCSICGISDDSLITADYKIHQTALANSIDSLLISPGHIELKGFDYGFIGGASFSYLDRVYFFGDISKHPDYDRIASFCHKHSRCVITLGKGPLTDYGSAVAF